MNYQRVQLVREKEFEYSVNSTNEAKDLVRKVFNLAE